MPKVISFFNHKGGVGKTTTVHNIGYGLASLNKKVLLIDTDPQMNLTAAVYGLSTDVHYGEDKKISSWIDYNKKYTSLEEFLSCVLTKKNLTYNLFQDKKFEKNLHLLRGSIKMNSLDTDLIGIVKNKNNLTKDYFSNLGKRLEELYSEYDFVLIDQSPSAASIINAICSLSANYVVVPASPTFFSVQAVNNLQDVWKNWHNLLSDFANTYNDDSGIPIQSKFIGMILQLGKRFKSGNAAHTNQWKEILNNGLEAFINSNLSNSINKNEFKNIFKDSKYSNPYIIAIYVNFTDKLRSISESKGLPFVALTQEDLPKETARKDRDKQYLKTWNSMQEINKYVCNCFTNLP